MPFAVVADTGPLVSALSASEGARHELAAAVLTALGSGVLVPWPVYVEVDLLCRARGHGRQATAFGQALLDGELVLADLTQAEHATALRLLDRYASIGVDLPDASVMAMADRRRAQILTWDFRHFRGTVPRRGASWHLVVEEHELP